MPQPSRIGTVADVPEAYAVDYPVRLSKVPKSFVSGESLIFHLLVTTSRPGLLNIHALCSAALTDNRD